MSSPFADATIAGYKPDEILKFLIKNVPGMGDRIKKAFAMGYTADEVLQFLKQTGQGAGGSKRKAAPREEQMSRPFTDEPGRLVETQRQEKASKKAKRQDVLTQTLDPKHLLSTGAGAAIGYATGGPMGAISGAVGGSAAYDDLVKKYEEQVASGSDVTFYDFVRNMAQAAAKGTAVGFSLSQLNSILNALKPGQEAPPQEEGEQPPTEPTEPEGPTPVGGEVIEADVTPVAEEPPVQAAPERDIKASYDIFKKIGVSTIIDGIADQVEGFDQFKAIRQLYGPQFIKDLERQYKRPAEEIISEAFEYARQKKGAVKEEESVETVAEQPEVSPEKTEERARQIESEDPRMAQYIELFKERTPATGEGKQLDKKPKSLSGALKSSNVRGAFYDADTEKMRVIFAPKKGSNEPGAVYTYDNVDKKTFDKMVSGEARPVTEGENKFGLWFNQKDPSIGATFSKEIRKNPDKFPYEKVGPEDYTLEEKQISEADRTFLVSELFEPFEEMRKKGRKLSKASELRKIMPTLRQVDDDFVADMIDYIEDKIKLKNPATMKRLQKEITKEFL